MYLYCHFQTFKVDISLRQSWKDPRLDLGENKLTLTVNPADYIWIPDTYFTNARNVHQYTVTKDNTRTVISKNGSVYLSYRYNSSWFKGQLISIKNLFLTYNTHLMCCSPLGSQAQISHHQMANFVIRPQSIFKLDATY